ncbi:HD domain-containing phosphohydrolase [Vibrio mangrovi]|nr:HD domain-containing phosphohydrolase [Vibrio mangrovi]MDW6003350.1 transporter substrate-binding domain-containing protein [Vibrio mangrovi]
MSEKIKLSRFSIKMTVMSLFIVLSSLIIAVALSLQYYFSRHLAQESSHILFSSTAQRISEKINSLDVESGDLALLLSQYPGISDKDTGGTQRPITNVMAQAMRQKPYLYAIYIGYQNGNFYELINLDSSENLRETLQATASDRWLIVHIYDTPSGRQREFKYLNDQFRLTHQRSEPSRYYANVRPWYRDAMKNNTLIKTEPYIFHNTQAPGTTYAKRIPDSNNVIAVDISLATLSAYLHQNRLLEKSNTLLFDRSGKIYAHSFAMNRHDDLSSVTRLPLTTQEQQYLDGLGTIRVSNEENWPPFDFSYSGQPQGYSIDLLNLLARKLGLTIEYSNGYTWTELVDLFQQQKLDMLHSVFYTAQREKWGLFSQPYLKLAPVLVTREDHQPVTDLEQLNHGKTVAIPAGWAFVDLVRNNYADIKVLEVKDTLAGLKAVSDHQADAAFDNYRVVQYFIDRYSLKGLTLHTELNQTAYQLDQQLRFLVHHEQPELQALLNKAILSLTPAERDRIEAKWLGGSAEAKMQRAISSGVVPSPAFVTLAVKSKHRDASAHDVLIGDEPYTLFVHRIESQLSTDSYVGIMVPTAVIQAPYMEKVNYSLLITLGLIVMLTPVLFSFANMIVSPVNQLAEENQKIRQRKFKAVKHVPSHIREINDLSRSISSMAVSIEEYQRHQEALIDSFIQLIAQAIDDKSPYTGGHCARVPELAMMLAESAANSKLPAFQNFNITGEEQWREFRVAAWLHDCGKVTTPEYIIDKGSKLETIYNRIHEIRMRFEVLWRDAEIAFWQGLASGESRPTLEAILSERHRQLSDDFAFIAHCNIGSDFMDDEKVARIGQIAQQTWTRHLDKRLGLSPQEAKHVASIADQSVPAQEALLADLAEHIIPWTRSPQDKVADDMQMEIPEHQSNLGEIYNLSIRKGTLTEEDRYRINEHIIATIQMLNALPLPEELARIPEIAGGHHEKLDGTGYPKRLSAKELSIEARILAIADVFEALTASDRPYKEAKTLAQAIDIMAKMTQEQHLDSDLFQLLLSSNIYQQYASRFLDKAQCDEVNIEKYLLRK